MYFNNLIGFNGGQTVRITIFPKSSKITYIYGGKVIFDFS